MSWPQVLGSLIHRASTYYEIKLNLLQAYNETWNKVLYGKGAIVDPLISELINIKFNADIIKNTLNNIEIMSQKNTDNKT